jgi:hypothetical protein
LDGTFYSFGEYQECLDIKQSFDKKQEIFGKYCLIKIKIPLHGLEAYFQKNENLLRNYPMMNIIEILNYVNGTIFNLGLCFPHSCLASEIENLINKSKFHFSN